MRSILRLICLIVWIGFSPSLRGQNQLKVSEPLGWKGATREMEIFPDGKGNLWFLRHAWNKPGSLTTWQDIIKVDGTGKILVNSKLDIPKNGTLVKVGALVVDGALHYLSYEGNKEKETFDIIDFTVDDNGQLQNKRVLWSMSGIKLMSFPEISFVQSNDGSKVLIYSRKYNFFLLSDSSLQPIWNGTYDKEVIDNLDDIVVTNNGFIGIRDSRLKVISQSYEIALILINTETDEAISTQMTPPKLSLVSDMFLLSNDKNEIGLIAFSAHTREKDIKDYSVTKIDLKTNDLSREVLDLKGDNRLKFGNQGKFVHSKSDDFQKLYFNTQENPMHLLQINDEFHCENYYVGNVHCRHTDYGSTAYIHSDDGLKVFMSLPQSGRSSDLAKTQGYYHKYSPKITYKIHEAKIKDQTMDIKDTGMTFPANVGFDYNEVRGFEMNMKVFIVGKTEDDYVLMSWDTK